MEQKWRRIAFWTAMSIWFAWLIIAAVDAAFTLFDG